MIRLVFDCGTVWTEGDSCEKKGHDRSVHVSEEAASEVTPEDKHTTKSTNGYPRSRNDLTKARCICVSIGW